MTDYYVDSNTGDNGDNGTTQALAWATLEYALESGGLSPGDDVWVRRTHSETPTTDVEPAYDGSASSPIQVIGWPRAAIPDTTITQATWTNGSTTVDLIVGITCDREQHQGRFATGPDGGIYFITDIIDSNTLIIDREYAGATVSAANGKFQIEEDEDYDDRPTDVDGWDSDAIDLPLIDFNAGSYQFTFYGSLFHVLKNLRIEGSTDAYGNLQVQDGCCGLAFIGCLILVDQNIRNLYVRNANVYMYRTIIEGNSTGTAQYNQFYRGARLHAKYVAIYGMGDYGLYLDDGAEAFLEHVNIGVESANGDDSLALGKGCRVIGRDVKIDATNGGILFLDNNPYDRVLIENEGNTLDDHEIIYSGGTITKAAVTGETPNKKVSDDIIKISPNISGHDWMKYWAMEIFCHEFEVTTDQKSYKYWLYNDTGGTLNDTHAKEDIWLELEYVSAYDDGSEYVIKKQFSAEIDILDAANADDWDYLQITNITPAVASKLRIKCFCAHYAASGDIFIDPAVVVS